MEEKNNRQETEHKYLISEYKYTSLFFLKAKKGKTFSLYNIRNNLQINILYMEEFLMISSQSGVLITGENKCGEGKAVMLNLLHRNYQVPVWSKHP